MKPSTRWGATLLALCVLSSACGELEGLEGPEEGAGMQSSAAALECGRLRAGEFLLPGESIQSCWGTATLFHQGDGNVVVYDDAGALWSTGTYGKTTSLLVMQTDGNLVLYKPNGVAIWNTGTQGHPGAYMALTNNCNLKVLSSAGVVLWASATSCRYAPPAAPSNVMLTPLSETRVRLTWTDNAVNERYYFVSDGFTEIRLAANTTSYEWDGFAQGQWVCLDVYASNGSGASSSPGACARTWDLPDAPTNLTATAVDATSVQLTWSDNSYNEMWFVLTRGTSTIFLNANVTSTIWHGLASGTDHCFQLVARNQYGDSAPVQACARTP